MCPESTGVKRIGLYHGPLYRGESEGELFDLQSDPSELHNLWNRKSARALRAEMSERLAHRLMEYADSSPRPEAMA